jgi:type VI protein secretion system component Hcp
MADNLADVYVNLDGLKGECTDYEYSGDKGWVQIQGFSFSFGLKSDGQDDEEKDAKHPGKDGKTPAAGGADPKKTKKPRSIDGPDSPFDRQEVTLSKRLDLASATLWKDKCYNGQPIPKIKIVVCRHGGELGAERIAFLEMVFEEVRVRSISLQLGADGTPEESLHFIYDTVKVQYTWTANDTGNRVRGASAPRAGWNFKDNKPASW